MIDLAASSYPMLNILLTTMWVFLWILWLFLLVRVFADLFRDDEVSGGAKAAWSVFLIVLPFLGVMAYLIARGKGMGSREAARSAKAEEAFREYVQEAAAPGDRPSGHVQDLARLAELKNHGDITEDEYQKAKTKVLAA
ncbi:PLDc N-terminal domain-containing protein [Kitasatospora sp. LaBMicrA B282]|uniref:SHOCT domain-containing protein n=1 Tax=Kitasatospora sp. LaBMicrA B282 TaxID=3420949 RepID=UPI003D113838